MSNLKSLRLLGAAAFLSVSTLALAQTPVAVRASGRKASDEQTGDSPNSGAADRADTCPADAGKTVGRKSRIR